MDIRGVPNFRRTWLIMEHDLLNGPVTIKDFKNLWARKLIILTCIHKCVLDMYVLWLIMVSEKGRNM